MPRIMPVPILRGPSLRAEQPTRITIAMATSTYLLTTNHGAAYLFHNDGGNRNQWLKGRLTGDTSNRSGIGAVVRIESASGSQWKTAHSGSSYCSQSDLAITFGLGADTFVRKLQGEWPSGIRQVLTNVPSRQFLVIKESPR